MARVFVLVLAALAAMLNIAAVAAAPPAGDKTTTLEEVFIERHQLGLRKWSFRQWLFVRSKNQRDLERFLQSLSPVQVSVTLLPIREEILQYLAFIELKILTEMASDLSNTTVKSIYDYLNDHCGELLDKPMVDLRVQPSNLTCVTVHLLKMLKMKFKKDIDVAMQKFTSDCLQQRLPLCRKVPAKCTTDYEEETRKMISNYVDEASGLALARGSTPLEITEDFLSKIMVQMSEAYQSANVFLIAISYYTSSVPSIEPFAVGNLILPKTSKEVETIFFRSNTSLQSQQQLSWGIVRSDAGKMVRPCSVYKDVYPLYSKEYFFYFYRCYYSSALTLSLDLIRCALSNGTSTTLAWSTAPAAYFHSQCLCLAYNGTKCGVKPPRGVDPHLYCLSMLLRDFQQQVYYRPAVTYLDYAFETRVPVCHFTNLLKVSFRPVCYNSSFTLESVLAAQCYFDGLLNKQLNCTESRVVETYNQTELCVVQEFTRFVVCEGGDGDVDVPVPFYKVGDSTLVLLLTYGEVAVRVLTMVTFLACPQLRNLPGKLLIGYLVTSLLRLLVVRSTPDDMELAVRLDVATDLATTFCLFSYLHFLTVSIRDLRPPNSISRDEARVILLRYSLLGWLLPAALSVSFFSIDDFIDHQVKIGQLSFLLCNYLALFGNLCMCCINCKVYYDIKSGVRDIKRGSSKRDDIIALFTFAIKTSVLSGAGITFRLVFTQIQGLEELLGYYHAFSTLQGLLVFLFFGCNHEARAFWLQVFRLTLSHFRPPPRQNAPV